MRKWMILFWSITIMISMNVWELNAEDIQQKRIEIMKRIELSTVLIIVNQHDSDNPTGIGQKIGTGFIVSSDGYILTCAHVIRWGIGIPIVYVGNEIFQGNVVRIDEDYDVAILKINPKSSLPLPLELGNSDEVKEGEGIAFRGYPFILNEVKSFPTTGIASKVMNQTAITKSPIESIGISASVNHGNSGGPLFRPDTGEVMGIVSSKLSDKEGIGFAIPINVAKQLLCIGTSSIQESAKIHVDEERKIQKEVNFEVYLNDKKIADKPLVFKRAEEEIGFTFKLRLTGEESARDTYFHVVFPKALNIKVENPWVSVPNMNDLQYQITIPVIHPSMKSGVAFRKIWVKFPAVGKYGMMYVIQSEKTDEIRKEFTIQIEE